MVCSKIDIIDIYEVEGLVYGKDAQLDKYLQ